MDRLKYFLLKSLLLQFGFLVTGVYFILVYLLFNLVSPCKCEWSYPGFTVYVTSRFPTAPPSVYGTYWSQARALRRWLSLTHFLTVELSFVAWRRWEPACLISIYLKWKKVYRWMKSNKCAIFSQPVCQSVSQLVDRSILFSESVSNLVSQWNSELVRQWESEWVGQSVSRSVVIQLFHQSVSQSVTRSVNLSVSQ